MRKIYSLLTVTLLFLSVLPNPIYAEKTEIQKKYLINFKENVKMDLLKNNNGVSDIVEFKGIPAVNAYLSHSALKTLEKNNLIESIEPDSNISIQPPQVITNLRVGTKNEHLETSGHVIPWGVSAIGATHLHDRGILGQGVKNWYT